MSKRHKRLARSILIVKSLFFKFGVRSSFVRSPIRGSIIVNYMLDRNRILVKLNFCQLDRKNLGKVFVLNEQGAHFFSTYSDSEGLRLVDEEIGIWDDVTAQSARIINEHNKIGFCLKPYRRKRVASGKGSDGRIFRLDWFRLRT